MERQLAVDIDALAVGTLVNVNVTVTLEMLDGAPDVESASYDHVVEASTYVPSGRLVIMGCTDYEPDAHRMAVPSGWIRIRVAKSNLDAAQHADRNSDADPATTERLRIQAWPAEKSEPIVHKLWHPGAAQTRIAAD